MKEITGEKILKFLADAAGMNRLINENQGVCRYALPHGSPATGRFPDNPNGSMNHIVDICDPADRIFGLMPHPEAFNHYTNHPNWLQVKALYNGNQANRLIALSLGLFLFERALNYLR